MAVRSIPGSVLVARDDQGQDVFFEFRLDGSTNPPNIPDANFIPFTAFDSADTIRDSVITAINAAAIGIDASVSGPGRVDSDGLTKIASAPLVEHSMASQRLD